MSGAGGRTAISMAVTPPDPKHEHTPTRSDLRRSGSHSVPFASATENRNGCGYRCRRCASLSSRIRPANDRETSRNNENGRSIESAGQEPDSRIVAGSETGPENTLKEESLFVVIPAGEVGGNGRISSASLR
jgi:hypothetical protein